MQTGLVSVMMPAYNAETYIKQAIDSVFAQSYSNWELVIIDDGSTDQTSIIASQYGDVRVKVVHQENQGEAAARNTALRNIRGEFLSFLDADDIFLPHHLKAAVEYLGSHLQIDGVYTDGYYITQAGNRLQTLSSRRRGPFEGNLFEQVVYGPDVFGPPVCVVLRTNLIYAHDLKFDENILIGPDWDFFVNYADLAQFGYIDKITCLYRLHMSNISLRTGLQKRALELAKCRINAIRLNSFEKCSIAIQTAVFYDLLVNLLLDFPERQSEITQWSEFIELPGNEQARLLRLMASKTVLHGKDWSHVRHWLDKSRRLSPKDWRTALLWLTFRIHPKILSMLLKIKDNNEVDPRSMHPFADMKIDGTP